MRGIWARILAVVLALWPVALLAGPVLPDALQKKVARDPAAFVDAAAELIAGYGADGAIDAAGIGRMVAVARAKARGVAMGGIMALDLDADGTVTAAELASVAPSQSAYARGRQAVQFAKADRNGDGQVTAAELTDFGMTAALAAFPEKRAADLMALLGLDANGDGRVTVAEVTASLTAMGVLS